MNIIYFINLLALFSVVKLEKESRFTLKQVVILSRHGLRSPLSKVLTQMTSKKWPEWNEQPGYLTEKGAILEGYMGEYFSYWLRKENLLLEFCPYEDMFFVYANTKQRTRASAKAFVNSAFPGCNITIHHSKTDVDPIFNPIVHNTSSIFRKMAIQHMQEQLNSLTLNSSYKELDKILDYKDSQLCISEHKCDLIKDKNKVILMSGEKPNINGPIKIGNSVTDAFVMQYYEGFPIDKVAWGQLRTPSDWMQLIKVARGYHNVIFNTRIVANDICEPLIKYIKTFIFSNKAAKIVLLMGHDANLYTLLKSLEFKPYSLPGQYELCPIGGKVVFQKWFDAVTKQDLLKIDYIYQSTDQLRNCSRLSIDNPPQFKQLELKNCKVNEHGFCLWNEFKKILDKL